MRVFGALTFLVLLSLLESLQDELFRNDSSCNHAVESDIPKDSFPDEVQLVLFGNLPLKVAPNLLLLVRTEQFRDLDGNELLKLVNVAQVHRHLQDLVILEIWPVSLLQGHFRLSLIFYRVKEWTLDSSRALVLAAILLARLRLVEQGMIFLLFPAVAVAATGLVLASF